ncbi:MAG: AAA family ATPase [Candidatus Thiodiazotropha sp.]
MAKLYFPIIFQPLNEDHLLGTVLGEDKYFVGANRSGIKRSASEWLQKESRDFWVDEPTITNPQLTFHNVTLQLSYRDNETDRAFPLSGKTSFRVAAVHSERREDINHSECFLPYLNQRFYYYDSKQLDTLIHHFTRDFLEQLKPESVLQYIMQAEPTLDVISIPARDNKKRRQYRAKVPEILKTVTEPYPPSSQVRKSVGRWPKAAWERGEIVQKLTQSLLNSPDNLLLVGESGVGKSTISYEAIRGVVRLSKEKTGRQPLTFWRTTPQRLIGKAKYLGEWQAICDEVVEALAEVNGVLVLTDTIDALRAGGSGAEDSVAAYLGGYLNKGRLRMLGEVTPNALEAAKGLLPVFIHNFKLLNIEEQDNRTTAIVMKRYLAYADTNYKITTSVDAMELSLQLVNRYIKYQKNPGKQVQFFSRVIRQAHHEKKSSIESPFVLAQFIQYTGLPSILLDDTIPLTKQSLLSYFKEKIKGQDNVLEQISILIQTFKAGINDPHKPIATLLFAGPTGVGKTAAAKALSEYFFANGQTHNPLLRIDMSEFQHPSQIGRLIGFGNDQPGKLNQHVRNKPFSVVLLDEIEKAHNSIFDNLLSMLDEGLLTDRFGRTADFRNTIIIMTTNLGIKRSKGIGFTDTGGVEVSLSDIKSYFRPEFFNRIDQVLTFNGLNQSTIEQIAVRELQQLAKRPGILQRSISLKFTDALIQYVSKAGFSPEYGARPLQRTIERVVIPPLTEMLLAGKEGQKLEVDWVDEGVRITPVSSINEFAQ